MKVAKSAQRESSVVFACNTLSPCSAARPVRVMSRLSQLPPPHCFTCRPFDLRDPPPTAEDAFRQSLQPTCCQRAPDDSTTFLSRQFTLPSTAAEQPCFPPRRRSAASFTRDSALALVHRRNDFPASSARVFDGTRDSYSPGTYTLRRAAPLGAPTIYGIVRHGSRCTTGTADATCHPHARRQPGVGVAMRAEDHNPSPASTRKGPLGPRHLPPLEACSLTPTEAGTRKLALVRQRPPKWLLPPNIMCSRSPCARPRHRAGYSPEC
jgi:hypothetical protein